VISPEHPWGPFSVLKKESTEGLGDLLKIQPLAFKQIDQTVSVSLFYWILKREKAILYIDAKDNLYRELKLNTKVWIYSDGRSIVTLPACVRP
jgi:hypothetical protein